MWNPLTLTPTTNNLFHTPTRIRKHEQANIQLTPININPNFNAREQVLDNVRIFGSRTGYKANTKVATTPQNPARTRQILATPRAEERITIYTDGSSKLNGWENSTAGIGNWHATDSDRNISLKMPNTGGTNQRAELAAILCALQSNYNDDLLIISDSLTSLKMIRNDLSKYEDRAWHGVKNADILMQILVEIRTRPATCELKWIKAHNVSEGNNMADKLADAGRLSDDILFINEVNPNTVRALHDGARLSALKMRDIYSLIRKISTEGKNNPLHPENIDDAKDMLELVSGFRPTTHKLINGTWKLGIPNRLKDHIWNMLLGRIKTGNYWKHIPGYEDRTYCLHCTKNGIREVEESELHLWLECPYNGQTEAWKCASTLWKRTSKHPWPRLTIGLLKGISALALPDSQGNPTKDLDSERLRLIISMTIWAIWKTRNKHKIQNLPVTPIESAKLLKTMLKDLITQSHNSMRFEPEHRRSKRTNRLKKLWKDGTIVHLDGSNAPIFDF